MMDVLIVDGYNIIGASEQLSKLKLQDMELARHRLIELLSEYKAFVGYRIIIVFDALYVKGTESRYTVNNIEVIYTQEDETADECIERLVKKVKNIKNKVYVATSDYLEQRTILSRGALRISARELLVDMKNMEVSIDAHLKRQKNKQRSVKLSIEKDVLEKLEKLRRGNIKNK